MDGASIAISSSDFGDLACAMSACSSLVRSYFIPRKNAKSSLGHLWCFAISSIIQILKRLLVQTRVTVEGRRDVSSSQDLVRILFLLCFCGRVL